MTILDYKQTNPPNNRKIFSYREYKTEELLELIKCFQDPIYFCNTYCKIVTLDKGLTSTHLFPYQETMIKAVATSNYVICKFPRQSGKTTATSMLCLWLALFNDDYNIGIVAQNEKTAIGILSRVKKAYDNLPEFLKMETINWSAKTVVFVNGSMISVSGTSAASARGGSYNFLYLDEFAFVPDHIQHEFYQSTIPTITAGNTGKILITSTPHGLNKFYKIWKDSENGNNKFRRVAIEWFEVPGRDEKWRREQENLLGKDGFLQEYNCDFLGSTHTLISAKKLQEMSWGEPLQEHDGLDIYKYPTAGHQYIIVADVSQGINLDYSAFIVFDVTKWPITIAAKYQNNKINSIKYAQLLVSIAKNYNNAYCLVEVNNIGIEIADIMFTDFEYTNLFSCHNKNKDKKLELTLSDMIGESRLGVITSQLVKRLGCNSLKNMIESDRLIIEDHDIIEQLSVFVQFKKSYQAEAGKNDDLVVCLFLFAYLVDSDIYKQLSDKSFRKELLTAFNKTNDEQVGIFGFSSVPFQERQYNTIIPTVDVATFDNWLHDKWGTSHDDYAEPPTYDDAWDRLQKFYN